MTEDGSLLSALVNAVSVALMDAGVQMSAVILGVTIAIDANGLLMADPNASEQREAKAVIDFVFDSLLQGIIASRCRGVFTLDQFNSAADLAAGISKTLLGFIRKSMRVKGAKKAD